MERKYKTGPHFYVNSKVRVKYLQHTAIHRYLQIYKCIFISVLSGAVNCFAQPVKQTSNNLQLSKCRYKLLTCMYMLFGRTQVAHWWHVKSMATNHLIQRSTWHKMCVYVWVCVRMCICLYFAYQSEVQSQIVSSFY